jgi:hypothetical protein
MPLKAEKKLDLIIEELAEFLNLVRQSMRGV